MRVELQDVAMRFNYFPFSLQYIHKSICKPVSFPTLSKSIFPISFVLQISCDMLSLGSSLPPRIPVPCTIHLVYEMGFKTGLTKRYILNHPEDPRIPHLNCGFFLGGVNLDPRYHDRHPRWLDRGNDSKSVSWSLGASSSTAARTVIWQRTFAASNGVRVDHAEKKQKKRGFNGEFDELWFWGIPPNPFKWNRSLSKGIRGNLQMFCMIYMVDW